MSANPTTFAEPVDCLIVGAGPAGLTAALYLRRFHRRVCLVDAGQARALRIPLAYNVPGFPNGISGSELLARMREHLTQVGGEVVPASVSGLRRHPSSGFLAGVGPMQVHAHTVLLATGAPDNDCDLPGTQALWDHGLMRQCPICDGFEHTGKCLAVIGHGTHAARESLFLRHFSERVWLIDIDGHSDAGLGPEWADKLSRSGVRRMPGRPTRFATPESGGAVVKMDDGREHRFDVVYGALGCQPRVELATALSAGLGKDGNLLTDAHCQTDVSGLYAAGDVTRGLDQIVVAYGQAAIAATAIHNKLRSTP